MGRNFTTLNYSSDKLYEICRNHWIVIRMYSDVSMAVKRHFVKTCYKTWVPRIIFGEKDRMSKLWAVIRGTYDGLCFSLRTNDVNIR